MIFDAAPSCNSVKIKCKLGRNFKVALRSRNGKLSKMLFLLFAILYPGGLFAGNYELTSLIGDERLTATFNIKNRENPDGRRGENERVGIRIGGRKRSLDGTWEKGG